MYLCGVRSVEGEGEGGEDVREYLYETAWRCTKWEGEGGGGPIGAGMSLGTATRKGYHQSLFDCINFLKDGELNLLQTSLNEARYI